MLQLAEQHGKRWTMIASPSPAARTRPVAAGGAGGGYRRPPRRPRPTARRRRQEGGGRLENDRQPRLIRRAPLFMEGGAALRLDGLQGHAQHRDADAAAGGPPRRSSSSASRRSERRDGALKNGRSDLAEMRVPCSVRRRRPEEEGGRRAHAEEADAAAARAGEGGQKEEAAEREEKRLTNAEKKADAPPTPQEKDKRRRPPSGRRRRRRTHAEAGDALAEREKADKAARLQPTGGAQGGDPQLVHLDRQTYAVHWPPSS